MRTIRVAAILGMTAVLGPATAKAVTLGTPTTYCLVSGSFSACASATFSLSGNELTVVVKNLSGIQGNTSYQLTAIGFFYKPAPNPLSGTTLTLDSGPWINGLGYGIDSPLSGEEWLGGAYAENGDRLGAGESRTFVFNVGDGTLDIENLSFAWRGQDWSAADGTFSGQSLKCYSRNGSDQSTGLERDDASCGTTVTPEPVSLVLLGTGLAGLSGVGVIRRKRLIKS